MCSVWRGGEKRERNQFRSPQASTCTEKPVKEATTYVRLEWLHETLPLNQTPPTHPHSPPLSLAQEGSLTTSVLRGTGREGRRPTPAHIRASPSKARRSHTCRQCPTRSGAQPQRPFPHPGERGRVFTRFGPERPVSGFVPVAASSAPPPRPTVMQPCRSPSPPEASSRERGCFLPTNTCCTRDPGVGYQLPEPLQGFRVSLGRARPTSFLPAPPGTLKQGTGKLRAKS